MIQRGLARAMSLQVAFETKILKVDPGSIQFAADAHLNGSLPTFADDESKRVIQEASKILRDSDNIVAFPTETVYGLGGSSLNDNSILNIYKAKNRPSDNPLITHVSSIDQLNRKIYGENNLGKDSLLKNVPEIYHSLIDQLWPGPLTILLPVPNASRNTLSKLTTASQSTFAVRIPSNPIARALIALSDTPIAAPSANASTRPSPTLASHVYHDLKGKIPLILDGGPCSVGVESTVVDGLCRPPMLLRPGGFTYEQIVKLGGDLWFDCKVERRKTLESGEKVRTPGMKYKHYAPSAKVILLVPGNIGNEREKIRKLISVIDEQCLVSHGSIKKVSILTTLQLANVSSSELKSALNVDLTVQSLGLTGEEIQANLFAALRKADEDDFADLIVIEGVAEKDEGLAVMNRLIKAAGNEYKSF
ncbi:hypothetical protein HG535_0B03550 [Zygotorulaspora mrakii]|uniref:Threonylcarbamoyl-AMP synthase n=1 Tax=Zygotorulaspora mrakii TaxID=42260 RepID=A0A7H9AYH8_ZYGMR|nr:uncharacterized protein HG535_0B03550 [Zygotorulaspora mrakii]QLG71316.1 hypothetical protein HG535_0B03550 [Zygotorulaspora mrakii]